MKALKLMMILVVVTGQSCKEDPNGDVNEYTHILSQQMMDYFVNYEVGTKWIYQDTADKTKMDTIDLTRIIHK